MHDITVSPLPGSFHPFFCRAKPSTPPSAAAEKVEPALEPVVTSRYRGGAPKTIVAGGEAGDSIMVDQDVFDSRLKADRFPLPRKMRAVQVGAFGGIEHLHLSSISVPTPGKGEGLVRVGAAGVGPWDVLIREGRSGLAVTLPVTLGAGLSGLVVEVGDSAEDLEPGDAVFGVTNDRFVGAYAEFALADASRLARKPVGLGFIEAGGMPVVAVTARSMFSSMAGCKVVSVSLSTAPPEPSAVSSFSLLMVQARK